LLHSNENLNKEGKINGKIIAIAVLEI